MMQVKNPKALFVLLLSNARQNAERTTTILHEMVQVAQDEQIKEALWESDFVAGQVLARLDECFKLIGEKPVKLSGRIRDAFVEDIRKDVADIQSPVAKRLYVLAKGIQVIHLRISEYIALIAAADITGDHAVEELLKSCLADKYAAVERARSVMRSIVETKVRERFAA